MTDTRPATRMAERRRNDMRVSKGRNAGALVAERMSRVKTIKHLAMPTGACNENAYENAVPEVLRSMKCEYLYSPDIERDIPYDAQRGRGACL